VTAAASTHNCVLTLARYLQTVYEYYCLLAAIRTIRRPKPTLALGRSRWVSHLTACETHCEARLSLRILKANVFGVR